MGKVYKPTISEELFERFCLENNIPFKRIQTEQTKTSDYEIFFSEHLIVTEIKQFDINDEDQKFVEELEENGVALPHIADYANLVRNKINSAKKQLKSSAQNIHPALLVLYDNVPTRTVNKIAIKQAMYGKEIDLISFNKNWQPVFVDEIFGENQKFTTNENTTFSAIALLEMNQNLCISIFHNRHARNNINPDWIRAKNIKHFSIDASTVGLKDWIEI